MRLLREELDKDLLNRFYDELIPSSGPSYSVPGEILRAASRIDYDLYNNGFGNDWSSTLYYLERMNKECNLGIKDSVFKWLRPYSAGKTITPYRRNRSSEQQRVDDEKYERAMERLDKYLMEPVLNYLKAIDMSSAEVNTFDSIMGKDIPPEEMPKRQDRIDISDILDEKLIVESTSSFPVGKTVKMKVMSIPVTGKISKVLENNRYIVTLKKG